MLPLSPRRLACSNRLLLPEHAASPRIRLPHARRRGGGVGVGRRLCPDPADPLLSWNLRWSLVIFLLSLSVNAVSGSFCLYAYTGFKMIGSFVTRALTLVLGYAYPAYDCYKTVELNRPEVEQLRFWCQYWILLAVLTVLERVGDNFVSWLPMYSEAKLAFIVYLWYPKTRGTAYVYESFFKPYIAKHETEIDRNLLELRTRAGDMAVLYFQRVANYAQTRSYEILQYIASQSQTQRPRPQTQQQQQRAPPPRTRQVNPTPPPVPAPTAPPMPPQLAQVPPAPPRPPIPVAPPGAVPPAQPQPPPVPEAVASNGPQNTKAMQIDPARALTSNAPPPLPPEETLIEEAIRLTRGRLRRRMAGGSGPPPN